MARSVLAFVLAPVLGLLAVLTPALLSRPATTYDSPLFPLLRTALEGIGVGQLVLLFVAGVLLGLISPARGWLLGAASVSLLPLATFAEIIKDPTSHNLSPLEFLFYALYGAVVAVGVLTVRRIRRSPRSNERPGTGVV
jgi:hypothetical protein